MFMRVHPCSGPHTKTQNTDSSSQERAHRARVPYLYAPLLRYEILTQTNSGLCPRVGYLSRLAISPALEAVALSSQPARPSLRQKLPYLVDLSEAAISQLLGLCPVFQGVEPSADVRVVALVLGRLAEQ